MNESQDLDIRLVTLLLHISETYVGSFGQTKICGSEDSMNRDLMFLLITYHLVTQGLKLVWRLIGKY